MSLARITLPTFILETRSTIERLTDWMVHADLLRTINDLEDPCMRALRFCTWVISGFHMGPRSPKKPYNSMLGECFRATLEAPNGQILGTYLAEQVSHHPPICAFHYADRAGGTVVWGHSEMRSRFLVTSVAAIMDNENTKVNFEHLKRGETYEFNLPDMYGRGFLTGRLAMEICGTVRVSCQQTGVFAKIKFLDKPALRGRYNCFKGRVYTKQTVKKKVIKVVHLTFSGRWSAYMRCKNEHDGSEWLEFDVRTALPLSVVVPPIEAQSPIESRSLWQRVTEFLTQNNVPRATEFKLALEDKQRALVHFMKDNGTTW
jgi:hypothetical protein